jgi:hypothetical protein
MPTSVSACHVASVSTIRDALVVAYVLAIFITVDELVSLAFVLGVSPSALLVPAADQVVRITPNTRTGSNSMWSWITGVRADGGTLPGESVPENQQRFHDESCPDRIAAGERRLPGVRQALLKLARLSWIAGTREADVETAFPHVVDLLEDLLADLTDVRRRAERVLSQAGTEEGK